jgi:hypothetical protein
MRINGVDTILQLLLFPSTIPTPINQTNPNPFRLTKTRGPVKPTRAKSLLLSHTSASLPMEKVKLESLLPQPTRSYTANAANPLAYPLRQPQAPSHSCYAPDSRHS